MGNEIKIQDAVAAVYRKYGANLAAFWRDAFAAEAQKHGDPVELHALDGNCIHCVPICHRCRIVTVECHLKDKDTVRAEAATAMRDKCVEKVKARLAILEEQTSQSEGLARACCEGRDSCIREIVSEMESLTLDQVKPREM